MGASLINILPAFKKMRVLVVGDVMLDRYLQGKVSRISPEAPVPVLLYENTEERLGGAANVALNLKALGATVHVVSVIGRDPEGERVIKLFRDSNIGTDCLVFGSRMTTVKTRVMAANQQLLRVDREEITDIDPHQETELIGLANKLMTGNHIDALIMEDYNKGVLTPTVINAMIEMGRKHKIRICIDPKSRNFFTYHHVDLIKPNLIELRANVPMEVHLERDSLLRASRYLIEKLECRIVMVTLSESGIFITDCSEDIWIKGHNRAISDVSGAGDTVISTATLALSAGLGLKDIACLANLAGGIVCESPGVAPVDFERFRTEVDQLE